MRRTLFATLLPTASLLLGVTLLVNTVARLLTPSLDATPWLVDLLALPTFLQAFLALTWAAALIVRAFHPPTTTLRIALLSLAAAALINSVTYFALVFRGDIATPRPIPLSAALCVITVLLAIRREALTHVRRAILAAPALAALSCLLQIFFFGSTDYRRPADAILVFGAHVYADGSPSLAAADRVTTAVALYKQGLATTLIMSGGPGDEPTSEPQAMKALAIRQGVPAQAIITDEHGLNTFAAIRNATASLDPGTRVLAVSHAYHLARIKLTCDREGLHAYTVPAAESRFLLGRPFFIAREMLALPYYYFSK